MSWDDKRLFNTVFGLSFTVIAVRLLITGINPFLRIILLDHNLDNYEVYKNLLNSLLTLVKVWAIASSYWLGKKSNLPHQYRGLLTRMGYSWVLAVILSGIGWYLTEDMSQAVFQIAFMYGIAGYKYLAPIFSGLVLGWIVEDRFKINPVFCKEILYSVLVYRGVTLTSTLIGSYLTYMRIHTGYTSEYRGVYMMGLSNILGLVGVWFLWRMFRSGREIELKSEYGSILFTLGLTHIAIKVVGQVSNMIATSQMSAIDLVYGFVKDIIGISTSIFETGFALLCFGYIHSRYMFVEKMERTRGTEN